MKKLLYIITGISLLLAPQAFAEQTAILALSSSKTSYEVGQDVHVGIFVDPKGQTYDTVQAEVNFPAALLEVKSFALNPAFSLTSPDNGFNNTAGAASYGAGIPGGTDQKLLFGTLTLKVKAEGAATVSLATGSVVLASGQNITASAGSSLQFALAKPVVPDLVAEKPKAPAPAPTVKKTEQKPASIPTVTDATAQEQPTEEKNPAPINATDIPIATSVASVGGANKNWAWAVAILLAAGAAYGAWRLWEKPLAGFIKRIKK